jgi:dedicator of cytokinesis protein 3
MGVFLDDGTQVKDCIFPGVGEKMNTMQESVSMVLYHTNTPRWRETVKVSLSPEKLLRAHLRFQFVHCSSDAKDKAEKKFCFSFLPLSRKGMIVANAEHILPLYKYDPNMETTGAAYLTSTDAANRFQKEFVIKTQLSSTNFTQNEQVFLLLRWRTVKSDEDLKQALHLVQFSPPAAKDILPFLRDFFDSLFSILERYVHTVNFIIVFSS